MVPVSFYQRPDVSQGSLTGKYLSMVVHALPMIMLIVSKVDEIVTEVCKLIY